MFYVFSPQKGMKFFLLFACYFLLSIFPAQKKITAPRFEQLFKGYPRSINLPSLGFFAAVHTAHTHSHGSIVIAQAAAHSTVVINYRQSSTPWLTVVPQFYDKRSSHLYPFFEQSSPSYAMFFSQTAHERMSWVLSLVTE